MSIHQSEISLFQVRRAAAQGAGITVKGTMMIGQVTGPTPPPTTNPLATLPPTRRSRLESEKETGPSGTRTTATDGSDLQPAGSPSPWFLCCLCHLWSLLPPCGDSWLLQSGGGGGGVLTCWSLKHIMKKKKKKKRSHSIWLHQQKKNNKKTKQKTKQANLAIIKNLFTAQNE